MELTFEQLPKAIARLEEQLNNIERLLLIQSNNNQTEPDRWFDINELCEYLPDKPAIATVYGWSHERIIPCHKKSKKLFFSKAEIDLWLRDGRKKTIAEIGLEAENYISKTSRR
jgi:hypothetical protein